MTFLQKTWILYIFGFFLQCNGSTSKLISKPNLVDFPDLEQKQTTGSPKYPLHYRVGMIPIPGNNYTGFRSAFQWTIGETLSNYGIQNAMSFSMNDSFQANVQLFGQIGIFSNGSQTGIHLSLDSALGSFAGPSFTCSYSFPYYTGSYSCFNSNYNLISKAIYFLDVEISGRSIRGYISVPQKNLTNMSNPYLQRNLIAEINWINGLDNLKPMNYWIANGYDSCDTVSEITTYNYIPEIYNKQTREKIIYGDSLTMTSSLCGPENTLPLTDWRKAVVYISRPPPQISDAAFDNY